MFSWLQLSSGAVSGKVQMNVPNKVSAEGTEGGSIGVVGM